MKEHLLQTDYLDGSPTAGEDAGYRGFCSCGDWESTLCGKMADIGAEFDEHVAQECAA